MIYIYVYIVYKCIIYDVVRDMSSEFISLCAWFNERRLSSSWSNILGLSFCEEINIPVSGPVRSSMCSKVTILNKIF